MDFNNCSSYRNISMSLEEFLQQLQYKDDIAQIPAAVILLLFSSTGTVGNFLVLIIYCHMVSTNPTKVLIMIMACLDLIATTVAIPLTMYSMFTSWTFSYPRICKILVSLTAFTTYGDVLCLAALAIIRYRKVCKPYHWQVTTRQAYTISVVIIATSCILTIPYAVIYGVLSIATPCPKIKGHECYIDDKYYYTIWPLANNIVFAVLSSGSAVILIVMYSLIGCKAYTHKAHAVLLRSSQTYVDRLHEHAIITKDIVPTHDSTGQGQLEGLPDNVSSFHFTDNSSVDGAGCAPKKWTQSLMGCGNNYEDSDVDTPSNFTKFNTTETTTTDTDILKRNVTSRNVEVLVANTSKYSSFRFPTAICVQRSSLGYTINPESTIIKEAKPQAEPSRYNIVLKNVSQDTDGVNNVCNVNDDKTPATTEIERKKQFKGKEKRIPFGRMTAMLIIISVVYLISFIPFLIMSTFRYNMQERYAQMDDLELVLFNVFYRLCFLNGAANPFIYSLCDKRFRVQCINFLKCARHEIDNRVWVRPVVPIP